MKQIFCDCAKCGWSAVLFIKKGPAPLSCPSCSEALIFYTKIKKIADFEDWNQFKNEWSEYSE